MKNPVVFWELACHDAEKSIAFFEKIFDWEFEQYPDSILYGAETSRDGNGIDGGIFTLRKARLPFMATRYPPFFTKGSPSTKNFSSLDNALEVTMSKLGVNALPVLSLSARP